MTQTEERGADSVPTAVERAEQLASQAGEQLGRLVGRTTLRFQHAVQTARGDTAEKGAPTQQEARTTNQLDQPLTTERAEEFVDQFEQRMAHWMQARNQQAKKVLARLREDAEDIWVDAQGMRGEWKRKRGEM